MPFRSTPGYPLGISHAPDVPIGASKSWQPSVVLGVVRCAASLGRSPNFWSPVRAWAAPLTRRAVPRAMVVIVLQPKTADRATGVRGGAAADAA
jgi:hypothetical protein